MAIGCNWEQLDKPIDWKEFFSNQNPVDCEIGFGNGSFLLCKAEEHPERNFFGVDYSNESFKKTIKAIEKAKLSNVCVVRLEAKAALTILIPENSLSHTYINFPDPWPKKKHEKNRLLDREFFALIASRTKKGGEIIIVTDDPFYRDFILEEMELTHLWKSLFHKGYTDELSGHHQTKYEKKWRKMGKEIYYMIFQKKRNPDKEFKIKEYKIKDLILSNFNPSVIEKIKDNTIKEYDSIAKLLMIDKTDNGIKMNLLLKDGTLHRKRTLHLEKSKNNKWKLKVPDELFCTRSFKIFTEELKTLCK